MKIPTIKRRKWHGKRQWQTKDADGRLKAFRLRPFMYWGGVWECADTREMGRTLGPKTKQPKDWTTTLRRIGPVKKGRKG